jgi:hypothetical protein
MESSKEWMEVSVCKDTISTVDIAFIF